MIDRFFDQPPVPGSGASTLTRFDVVEGLNREPKDEHVIADSLSKKIESNMYHQKPEHVNMARMQDRIQHLLLYRKSIEEGS